MKHFCMVYFGTRFIFHLRPSQTLGTDSVLTVSPNPIDFGELSSIFTKEITISIKNGTLYDLEIVDIYLEDSYNFKID